MNTNYGRYKMFDLDIESLYMMFLNGGAPVTDWNETKEWAENLLKVKETQDESTGTGN